MALRAASALCGLHTAAAVGHFLDIEVRKDPLADAIASVDALRDEAAAYRNSVEAGWGIVDSWAAGEVAQKKASVRQHESELGALDAGILSATAAQGTLAAEVDHLSTQFSDTQQSYKEAHGVRQREREHFLAEREVSAENGRLLAEVVAILERQHAVEQATGGVSGGAALLAKVVRMAQAMEHKTAVKPVAPPAAGVVIGYIKQMKETMSASMEDGDAQEQSQVTSFKDLLSTMGERMKTITATYTKKADRLAQLEASLAADTEHRLIVRDTQSQERAASTLVEQTWKTTEDVMALQKTREAKLESEIIMAKSFMEEQSSLATPAAPVALVKAGASSHSKVAVRPVPVRSSSMDLLSQGEGVVMRAQRWAKLLRAQAAARAPQDMDAFNVVTPQGVARLTLETAARALHSKALQRAADHLSVGQDGPRTVEEDSHFLLALSHAIKNEPGADTAPSTAEADCAAESVEAAGSLGEAQRKFASAMKTSQALDARIAKAAVEQKHLTDLQAAAAEDATGIQTPSTELQELQKSTTAFVASAKGTLEQVEGEVRLFAAEDNAAPAAKTIVPTYLAAVRTRLQEITSKMPQETSLVARQLSAIEQKAVSLSAKRSAKMAEVKALTAKAREAKVKAETVLAEAEAGLTAAEAKEQEVSAKCSSAFIAASHRRYVYRVESAAVQHALQVVDK